MHRRHRHNSELCTLQTWLRGHRSKQKSSDCGDRCDTQKYIADELKQNAVICAYKWTIHQLQHEGCFWVIHTRHERTASSDTEENSLAPTRSEEKKKNANKTPQHSTLAVLTGSHRLCCSCLMLWSQRWLKLQNWRTHLGLGYSGRG